MNEIRPIDANVAVEKLMGYVTELHDDAPLGAIEGDIILSVTKDNIEPAISEVPTLDYAPVVHAHWIIGRDPDGCIFAVVCSHCDENYGTPTDRFCRNCGARMDEEAKNIRNG